MSPFMLLQKERIRNLQPAYFAVVMATGIVSIACQLQHLDQLAAGLTIVNSAFFVVLVFLTIGRLVLFPRDLYADLTNHARAPGFLTISAGSALLGCEFIQVKGWYAAAFVLWVASAISWLLLTYSIFVVFTTKEEKPSLDQGINGGWLLAVVSTQAVAQLALFLIPMFPGDREALLFLGLALWLWGGMLYIWMISLIFYRYTFFTFAPSDLMPPYWINMGAMAISTLVGSLLAQRVMSSALQELRPFVEGFTIFFWATATWWIPMLVILGFWRHVIRRFPLAYDPLYWGAVFPLGVYAVATYRLAEVSRMAFLFRIPNVFTYLAFLAWLLTFLGMARAVLRGGGKPRLGPGRI